VNVFEGIDSHYLLLGVDEDVLQIIGPFRQDS